MAGFGEFLAHAAAGAMQGLGQGIVEKAKADREERLRELDHVRQMEREKREMAFRTSERVAGEQFTAAQNEASRVSTLAAKRAELAAKPPETEKFYDEQSGQEYIAQWNPQTRTWDREGGTKRQDTARPMTDDERRTWGIPDDDKRPFAIVNGEPKLIGGSGVNVNVGAGEKAWDTESAKLWAKRYDDLTAGAMNAEGMLGMYDLAEQALNSGVRTGVGGEAQLTLRQLGAAIGLGADSEKLAGGELIRAVQNRMALLMRSPDGGMGMPGALSDRDIKFLKDSQIGIDRSPEGNRKMLEAFRAMEKRKIEIAQLADEYIAENGRLDSGFNKIVREFAATNPLFPPDGPDLKNAGAPDAEGWVDLGGGVRVRKHD